MVKKEYTSTGRSCKVTFELPAEIQAQNAAVAGDFNDWSPQPMKRKRDGSFSATISLKPGREYRFRYLLDDQRWENDWQADRYERNTFGSEDSIVSV